MISLLIVFFLVAIITSFLCSMWEAVLLSITPSFTQVQVQSGAATGKRLSVFKENIDRPLSAILTLNTIAHTVGAIGVGEQATKIWSESNPLITGLLVPAVMTLAILVLSEIIPKTLGANYWKELAPFTVTCLSWLVKVLIPFVWFSQKITHFLKKKKGESVFSRSDFVAMAEIGRRDGVFEEQESDFIKNLMRFKTVAAKEVMTPRTVMEAASVNTSIDAFLAAAAGPLRFSRIPVYEGDDKDAVVGYVLKTEILESKLADEGDKLLGDIKRPLLTVPESLAVPDLFERFLVDQHHIAITVGEYGGVSGIITMEDVIETLLGFEIVDELDGVDDMQALARKNWERRLKRRRTENADEDG